jgi:predicted transcriptional regulator
MMQIVNVEACLRRLNCKQFSIAFLDIIKAFDTVYRKKLFEKITINNDKLVQRNIKKLRELLFNPNHTWKY